MVYARVKLAHVQLEAVSCPLRVFRQVVTQLFKQGMNAAPFYTGMRVCRKLRCPYRLKDQHNGPLHDPVLKRQFVNLAPFGLVLYKDFIR